MINTFLKAKHWQLFGLMFGLPMLFQIIMMTSVFASIQSESNPDPTEMLKMMRFFPIIMIVYMGLFFSWFWSIAIGLQNKVPQNVTMKTKRFKIFFFIPLLYILVLSFFIGNIFNGVIESQILDGAMMARMIGIILPLHLLSMFGIFHSLYFVSKTLKTVELQKKVSFSDFVGEFFMLWFYPVGIWIIQPKLNELAEVNTTSNSKQTQYFLSF